jgi:excisionase family DNA binding protein
MPKDMLTVTDVALILSIHPSTARKLIDRGDIKGIRFNEQSPRRVQRSEMERYTAELGIKVDWSVLEKQ